MKCISSPIGPFVLTEKSCILKDSFGKISFFAPVSVDKKQIRSVFVERFRELKVLAINSIVVKGKFKRFKGKFGRRSDRKKFVLTVEGGAGLDLDKL
ncbi:ribosomal L23 family protein [Neorickettsia helminthoeca str. Oregon]|uniref:50S ribosomal protein L23 n=1 Tax=Neorickettsia helminthoeca str. Oregon TaxID=1286528 RepID=X5GVV8_9RICK|nr:50S ribosomal protein L23 [Neorickettsia helminthoeca]AHX11212.1 ribosomal L23 family protein [Neorickettsia helminthoeca str. Oregon]